MAGLTTWSAHPSSRTAYGKTFVEKGYRVSNAYGLINVPTIFLIDSGGTVKVRCMGFGKKDRETIAAELASRKKMAPAAFFRPDEVILEHKPD
jgi:hypothetical protein